MEHLKLVILLCLLVLDCRVCQRPRGIHISHVRNHLPPLLHDYRTSSRRFGTNRCNLSATIQCVVCVCPYVVSVADQLDMDFAPYLFCSNGVLQPFRDLGWWQWMYYVTPFTYFIEGLLGQG